MRKIDKVRKLLFANKFCENLLLFIQKIPGCYNLSFKLLLSNHLYPKNTTRVVNRQGIQYELNIHDYQEWLIYTNSKADSSEKVLDYIGNADVILDIGANIGQTSLLINQYIAKTNSNFKLFAFEPHPLTFKKLVVNLALNVNNNVIPYQIGMGESKSDLDLVEDCETNSGGFRIGTITTTKKGVKIPISTIDDFIQEQGLSSVDFIKIDVEGFEFQVLLGAKQTLNKFKPSLYIEFCPSNLRGQNVEPSILLDYLKNIGYTVKDAHKDKETIDLYTFEGMTDLYCYCN